MSYRERFQPRGMRLARVVGYLVVTALVGVIAWIVIATVWVAVATQVFGVPEDNVVNGTVVWVVPPLLAASVATSVHDRLVSAWVRRRGEGDAQRAR